MTTLDPELVEILLRMSESEVVDFKRGQYPVAGASDDDKSELVKDVIAFANAWKPSDAHIVLGADENPGGRAHVVGVNQHLDDANLQQLVNSKTNRAIAFQYLAASVDGKAVGIVRIAKDQQRPIFLKKNYGKLRPGIVYIRRGSSTGEADPDEIARMGAVAASVSLTPTLELELGDPDTLKRFGHRAQFTSALLRDRPPSPVRPETAADVIAKQLQPFRHLELLRKQLEAPSYARGPAPEKLAAYRKEKALLSRVGFWVKNSSQLLVEDVRLELAIPKREGIVVVDELPARPTGPLEALRLASLHRSFLQASALDTSVSDLDSVWNVVARVGKIQPGAAKWSLPFWIGSQLKHELPVVVLVFGDNVPRPIEVSLELRLDAREGWLDDEPDDDDESDDES